MGCRHLTGLTEPIAETSYVSTFSPPPMADLISYAIEGAVAFGTIGATLVAVYQLRRDRRETLARELADVVYVPMRKIAMAWQNPELSVYGTAWKDLQEDVPYLTSRVPSDIKKLFERGEAIDRGLWTYLGPTTEFIRSQAWTPGTNTNIRFLKGGQYLGEIYLINIWKSRKPFAEYAKNFMARNHPLISDYTLVIWAEVSVPNMGLQQQNVGEDKAAYDYVDKVLKFLELKPEAVKYREMYAELEGIGAKAQQRIDKELRKRVAPMGSSPAKPPRNPFG